jgi:TonB family protein
MGSRLTIVFLIAIFVHDIARCADAPAQPQRFSSAAEKALVINGPRPDYPYEARRGRITGSGIGIIEVDPSTGKVTRTYMAISTGSPILDNATLYAFRRWRFKPGTVSKVKIPINFTLGGPPVFEYRVKQKPMDEVLAHFLGKGVVLKGPIPAYPRNPPWTEKHGQGVYELHVQKDGSVADVRILKASGDDKFDRIAVDTLRKWRLRRGPLILELPLSFTLTPTSYSVDIPKKH